MTRRIALLAILVVAGCARPAPKAGPTPGRAPSAQAPGAAGAAARPGGGDPSPRPYAQVITPQARTRAGLFKTHQVGSRLYFEIPRAAVGEEMLMVVQVPRSGNDNWIRHLPLNNRVIRWDRQGNRVLLRGNRYDITADTAQPISRAVEANRYGPVIAAFNVEAYGPDSSAVVEVTRLFTASPPELSIGNLVRGSLDRERSFVERVAAFPTNVEVEATQTYNVVPPAPPGVPEQFRPQPRTESVVVHWSMVKLPETPMMARRKDTRVGYFSVDQMDFGTEEHRAAQRSYITRWRLECPAGQSTPCEPVKPIVYYVDPATPAKWRPYIKQGVEDWQKAFEAAGFRNAIVARDAPTAQQDPDWSPEDARYSVVRWLPSTVENAVGPSVVDPRSGEILEADILMFHNVLNLLRDWYFVQAAPLDPRAKRLPFPDSLQGRLLRYVVAHEVGHTIGFPHNQKASATYPADSLRSESFLRRMGHTPTLMDYSRFNYVAQPEDRIPPELLIPDIGPYDVFAVKWGYTPIPGARRPEEELVTLDRWAREQDTKPYLRFMTSGSRGSDPGDQTEAVGDADPVKSTRLGLRNLRRVVDMLIPAVEQPGEDFADLRELYGRAVGQWSTEMNHVAIVVGGVESQEKRWGQEGVRFQPLPRARQIEAVRFLNAEAFQTPEFFIRPEILRRIEVEGAIERIGSAQRRVLANLLEPSRIDRMVEFEALATRPGQVYSAAEMVRDLRAGIWSELNAGSVRVDPFRRNLQRHYLDLVATRVNPVRPTTPSPLATNAARPSGEAQALLRGELIALDRQLAAALSRTSDAATRAHLQDARARIDRTLNPNG